MFLLFIKKGKNASIHQKRKPNSVENSSASESTEKQKDDTSKKDSIGENKQKKPSSSGSNLVVTSDQSIKHPNNKKQVPKEKAKTEDTNKEKETKKKIYILGDSMMMKHLEGWDISAKLKQCHRI